MRKIEAKKITETVKKLCMEANYNLRKDVLEALKKALRVEESPSGKEILEVLLKNAKLAREKRLPLCQDTGTVTIFLKIGQEVLITRGNLEEALNEGVRQGYLEGRLRKSMVKEPLFERENTGDNTPALSYFEIIPGEKLKITVMPKGAGCENVSALKMLTPAEGTAGLKKFVLETVLAANGKPCPPIILGLGIGTSFDKAPFFAKKALLREVGKANPDPRVAKLEKELLKEVNNLGIGPMGLGGRVTALGLSIETFPTHIGSLPLALGISCHSLRSASREL